MDDTAILQLLLLDTPHTADNQIVDGPDCIVDGPDDIMDGA